MKKFGKEVSLNILGNLSFALSFWAFTVIISRKLGLEELGLFALGLSITAPIALFFGLQFRMKLSALPADSIDWDAFARTRSLLSILCFAISSVIAVLFLEQSKWLIVMVVSLVKSVEMNSDFSFAVLQKHKRLDLVGLCQIGKSIIAVIAFLFCIDFGLIYACASLAAVYLGFYLIVDLPLANRYQTFSLIAPVTFNRLKKVFLAALPLGLSALFISLNANIPKYFIEYHIGSEGLAIFSILFYFFVFNSLLVNSIGQRELVTLSDLYTKNIDQYINHALKIIGLFVLLGLGTLGFGLLFGVHFLKLVYGPQLDISQVTMLNFMLLVLAGSFQSATVFVILGLQIFKEQFTTTVFTAFLTLVLSYFIVPKLGIEYSALPLALSLLVHGILYLFLASKKIRTIRKT